MTDEQIIKILYPHSWDYLCGANLVQVIANARAIESAATAPLLERIAELDRILAQTSGMNELQRMRIAELERKSDQDDETIQWQANKLAQRVPDGYKLVAAKGLEALCYALERAEYKGYLPEAMVEEWESVELNWLSAAPAAPEQQEPFVNERKTFEASEFSLELDAGFAAQEYCRYLWGAARGHIDWRKFHDAFVAGYKAAQQPGLAPNAQQAEAQKPCAWFCGLRPSPEGILEFWGVLAEGVDDIPVDAPLFIHATPAQLQSMSDEEVTAVWRGVKDLGDARFNAILLGEAIQSALAAKNGVEMK